MKRQNGKRSVKTAYRVLSLALVIGIYLFVYFRGQDIFLRLCEAVRDFALSLAYVFTPLVTPTVKDFSYTTVTQFPRMWDDVVKKATSFGELFLSGENFLGYLRSLAVNGRWFLVGFLLFLIVFALFIFGCFLSVRRSNTDHGVLSKPLRLALSAREKFFLPASRFLKGFFRFLSGSKGMRAFLIGTALLMSNALTVALEFFAFYFCLIFDFSLSMILTQLLKLVWDLYLVFMLLPLWLWIPLGVWLFDVLRKRIGYRRLDAGEERMRAFIRKRAVVFMITAPMREGKTTLLTSLLMSLEKIFREDARNALWNIEMRFPDFPFRSFEAFLKAGIRRHKLYSLESIRKEMETFFTVQNCAQRDEESKKTVLRPYILRMRRRFGWKFEPYFGYDTRKFRTVFPDGLRGETLAHALTDYAQLFFIYAFPSSMIVSNFNVRMDGCIDDKGNFPRIRDDFFRDAREKPRDWNAHVLNQDMLRLGVRKDPADSYVNALEFGVIGQQEIGKERGNQYDLAGLSAQDNECNLKTDQYNANLKLIGHSATIRFIPFVRFGCDDQRAESWGADAREMADIISILEKGNEKILMPFFALEEALFLFSDWLMKKVYGTFSYRRGDNTLLIWILKSVHSAIFGHYTRILNTFGGYSLKCGLESGMQVAGETAYLGKEKLFISYKKVYADRFDTAAWRQFYAEKASLSYTGLNDVPTYKALCVSKEELAFSHSHFFDKISKLFSGEYEREKTATAAPKDTPKKPRKRE